jgi:DNA-binding XRE family transcriptional regulator
VNHPSRNRRAAKRGPHPTGSEIRQAREEFGHTQTEAAESIHVALRTWQDYEGERRKMPPGLWEYYCLQIAYPQEMRKLMTRWRDTANSDWGA